MIGGPAAADAPEHAGQDFRLVPAAGVIWLAALLGLQVAWWCALVCGAAATIVAGVRLARRPPRGRTVAAAVALLLAGALSAVLLGVRLHASAHDPLRAEAEQASAVHARVSIRERPFPIRSGSAGHQRPEAETVLFTAEVEEALVHGRQVDSTGRVALFAPAEGWSRLLPGQMVTVSGVLAPPRDGRLAVATIRVPGDTAPAAVGGASSWQRAGAALRRDLRAASSVLPEDAAGLLPGLVIGDTSGMPDPVIERFRAAGMSHLVAVSGMHVSVVCGAVLLLLRAVRSGPRLSASLAGSVLAGYMITVGYTPSVLRAGLMAAVGLLALYLGRQRSAMPALALAVCVLVLYDPEMAVRFGFAMSVAATAALVVLAPRWVGSLRAKGVPIGIASAGVVPLVAFLATAPLIAGMAGEVSLVTVAANLLATPAVAATTVLGALATVTAGAAGWLGELFARSAWPGLSWLLLVARGAADVPGGVLGWPDGWLGGGLAALASLSCALACRYRVPRRILVVCLVPALVMWAVSRILAPEWPPAGWALHACDVGQGDGLVLATGETGRAVVVDTGSAHSGMVGCLDRLGVDRVPLLVVTHLHEDHHGDLPAVLDGTRVDAVAVGPGRTPESAWADTVSAAGNADVPLVELAAGDTMSWPDLDLRVIGPRHVPAEQAVEPGGTPVNDLSLVATADTPAGRILLTGDAEVAAQGDLLAAGQDLRADVLKVPHHGSGHTREEFLRAVEPAVAIISVGEGNQHEHPDKAVVDQLTDAGARVARTDHAGDIAVVPARDGILIARRY